MFVTKNQIFVFIACVAFGGVAGLAYSFSALIKYPIKNRWIKILPDVIVSVPIAVAFVIYSHGLNFPNIRAYMLVGVFIGLFLYFKSFYIILAKCTKKIYNIYKSKRIKRKNDRRKDKKINSRRHGRGSIARGRVVSGNGVSVNSHSGI